MSSHPATASDALIKEIRVEGIYSIQRQELLYLLDLKEGDPIDPSLITRGIKRAFLKAIFEDISVRAENGIITVKVKELDFIEDIRVRGNSYLSKKTIKKGFLLKEEGLMRYDLEEQAISRLKQMYMESGFPQAEVTMEVKMTDTPYRVNLMLNIKEGAPEIVKNINVSGRPLKEVKSFLSLTKGRVYDQFKLREDIERLRQYYRKQDYLNPLISYAYIDGELTINITTGKRLNIRIENNKALSSKALLSVMPFFEVNAFSPEFVQEAVSKMLSLYRARGYPFVQIAPVASESDTEIDLHFYIFEADKVKVASIVLEGVTIGAQKLKEGLPLKEGDLFNPDALDSSISVIKEFYAALGYLNASLEEPRIDIKNSLAYIFIKVVEGKSIKIASIGMQGMMHFSETELRKAIDIKEESIYNEVDIANARYKILDLYSSQGFIGCRVDILRNISGEAARIVFVIQEGPRVSVGKTIIGGNRKTRHMVIRRELDYKDGMPLDYQSITRSRQGLYRLGLFTDVSMDVVDRYEDKADIAIKVKEGKAGAVELGVGYGEYERYRGFLDVSYKNLFGMNKQAGLRTEMSSLESRQILNYYDPWFLGKRIPVRAFFLREERTEKNIDTGDTRYKLRRYTASIGTERRLGKKAKADIFYEFSLTKTFEVKPDAVLTKEDTGTLAVSSIRPGIVYDTRDNAFDPKKGIFAGMSVKVSSKVLFSEVDFVKVIVHGSTYKKLTGWLVAAVSLKGGAAKSLEETDELPLVERFFLGGRSTVRGYVHDGLGPKGSLGTPTGGNTFALGNLELRAYIGRDWSLVGFLDGGNVWTELGEAKADDLKYTTGMGLRYNTPVGPIRLDYGYKLMRQPGESKAEIHFSIGHAF